MALSFVFQVNGVDCPTPSAFGWSLQDISAADSGRTEDGLMHKNRIAQKRWKKTKRRYKVLSPKSTG